jgi:hypothetical protein
VLVELGRRLVVVALPGRLFERAVNAFDGTVSPQVSRLGQPVLHTEGATAAGKARSAWKPLVRLPGELHPVVGQYRRHFVR